MLFRAFRSLSRPLWQAAWGVDHALGNGPRCLWPALEWVSQVSQGRPAGPAQGFAALAAKGSRKKARTTSSEAAETDGNMSLEQRQKREALESALAAIYKAHGAEAVLRGGGLDPGVEVTVPVISTGSLGLDAALGVGGLPKGRVVEIYGPEASGKTTLALHVIAEAQKEGGTCVFIDAEHALDRTFASAIGVNMDELLVSQPDSGEQALEITDQFLRSNGVDVICVDSVAALVPKAELAGEMGDSHMGMQARLMSQALRKIMHSLARSNTLLIFINQIRHKLGTFGGFGPQETTSGGNALKFYASVRLNIKRKGWIKRQEDILGSMVRVKVAKNKLAPPFREADFEIEFGRGISKEGELVDLGIKAGLIKVSGAWYSYNGENIAQGRDKAKEYLRNNRDVAAKLSEGIKEGLQSQEGDRKPAISLRVPAFDNVEVDDAVVDGSLDTEDDEQSGLG